MGCKESGTESIPFYQVMTRSARYPIVFLCCLFVHHGNVRGDSDSGTTLRFAVTVADDLGPMKGLAGRLLVALGRADRGEPRLQVGQTGMNTAPVLGRDVAGLAPGKEAILDDRSVIFPIGPLGNLRPGTYAVQAFLHTNPDLNVVNAHR